MFDCIIASSFSSPSHLLLFIFLIISFAYLLLISSSSHLISSLFHNRRHQLPQHISGHPSGRRVQLRGVQPCPGPSHRHPPLRLERDTYIPHIVLKMSALLYLLTEFESCVFFKVVFASQSTLWSVTLWSAIINLFCFFFLTLLFLLSYTFVSSFLHFCFFFLTHLCHLS